MKRIGDVIKDLPIRPPAEANKGAIILSNRDTVKCPICKDSPPKRSKNSMQPLKAPARHMKRHFNLPRSQAIDGCSFMVRAAPERRIWQWLLPGTLWNG